MVVEFIMMNITVKVKNARQKNENDACKSNDKNESSMPKIPNKIINQNIRISSSLESISNNQ